MECTHSNHDQTSALVDQLNQGQRERLAFIDYCLFFKGEIRRGDLESRFGIASAASSRDLACYRGLAPHNLDYDTSSKVYQVTTEFKPLFDFCPARVLSWLCHGFGDSLVLEVGQPFAADSTGLLAPPSLDKLGMLARAIHRKRALLIRYISLSSGVSTREIVPLAFVDNGLRWHVRAFDRKNSRFGDFVVNRIDQSSLSATDPNSNEYLERDAEWNSEVAFEITPHPGVTHAEAVAADYGMKNGSLTVRTRAALAGYALARWNVDASADHHLNPFRHQLWLKNNAVLAGISSAALAPGYADEAQETV